MADEARVREALGRYAATCDFAIVDAGEPGIAPAEYAAAIPVAAGRQPRRGRP